MTQSRAKYDHGFYRPAPVADISVNLKIDVQRMGLNLCKDRFGAAYWARVSGLEHHGRIVKTHRLALHRASECKNARFNQAFIQRPLTAPNKRLHLHNSLNSKKGPRVHFKSSLDPTIHRLV
jgi:hypothetical protein